MQVKKEEKKQAILDASSELFLEKSYQQVTLSEIAKKESSFSSFVNKFIKRKPSQSASYAEECSLLNRLKQIKEEGKKARRTGNHS